MFRQQHDYASHMPPTYPDTSVGCILHSLEQLVPRRLKAHGESRIDYSTVDVNTKVNLHHVMLLQHYRRR